MLLARCTPDRADAACWNRWVDMVSFNSAGTGDTPMYLLHSTGDFVKPTHASRLCYRLRLKNVRCDMTTVDGSAHGAGLLGVSGIRYKVLQWIQAHD